MIEITEETQVATIDEFKEVAGLLLNSDCEFFLSPIAGAVYGIDNATYGRGVEVFDTVEDDTYRTESFPDLDSALGGFIVNGKPLSHFIPDITVYPVVTI